MPRATVLVGVGLAAAVDYTDVTVPLEVSYDERRRWIVVRGTGSITLSEVLTLIQTARADIGYRMWPMLFDARSATTEATDQEVEDAVAAVRRAVDQQGPRGHVALVADDDRLYNRMLTYETRCAEVGVPLIRTFRQAHDAERWLDIVSSARYFC